MIWIIVLVILVLLLYFMPLQIKIKALRDNNNDAIIIRIRSLYGLLNLETEIPFLDIIFKDGKPALDYSVRLESGKGKKLFKGLRKRLSPPEGIKLLKIYLKYKSAMEYINSKMKIDKLYIVCKFGFDDAFDTGFAYGAIWTFLGSLLAIAYNIFNISIKDVSIIPNFYKPEFNVELSGIITFKLGHIINAGIKILKIKAKLAKAQRSKTQTTNMQGTKSL